MDSDKKMCDEGWVPIGPAPVPLGRSSPRGGVPIDLEGLPFVTSEVMWGRESP